MTCVCVRCHLTAMDQPLQVHVQFLVMHTECLKVVGSEDHVTGIYLLGATRQQINRKLMDQLLHSLIETAGLSKTASFVLSSKKDVYLFWVGRCHVSSSWLEHSLL